MDDPTMFLPAGYTADVLTAILATALDGFWIADKEGRFLHVNQAYLDLTGYTREDLQDKTIPDLEAALDSKQTAQKIEEILITGSARFETQHRCKDGRIVCIEVSARVLPGAETFACFLRDITARIQTESALRRANLEYDAILNTATDGIHIVDRAGSLIRANDAFCRMLGYTQEELQGLQVWDWDAKLTRQEILVAIAAILETGTTFETRHRRRDLTVLDVEISAIRIKLGSEWFVFASARDITSRKRQEEELKNSQALLRAVIEGTPDAVYVKDTSGKYLMLNHATSLAIGRVEADVIGKDDSSFFRWEVANAIKAGDRRILDEGVTTNFDEIVLDYRGIERAYSSTKGPVRDHTGAIIGLFGISRDITEQRRAREERSRLQEQLQHAQKMESIGRLAGGVAHDFNNLLTVINGYCDLLMHQMPHGTPVADGLSEIRKAGSRAAALTQQLLTFSRRQVLQPRSLDLNSIVRDTERILLGLAGENVSVQFDLDARLGTTVADPSQMKQVLLNLFINAKDAMPAGGTVLVRTANMVIETATPLHNEGYPGSFVTVEVTDEGVGMDDTTLQRIFEPFFTTKDERTGTGLGLASVYGIVKQSGGWIEVTTALGRGSTFRVYLPRSDHKSEPAQPPIDAHTVPGSGTILVVEDQADVRRLATKILRGFGYTVLEAENARSALAVAVNHIGPIHALLTDVIMPEMNGPDLAQQLLRHFPSLKVVYMSGYPDEVISRNGKLENQTNFIPKPFSIASLTGKIHDVLSGADAKPRQINS